MVEKNKNRLIRSLLFTSMTLLLCGLVVDNISPFAHPLSFWWVIKNAIYVLSMMMLLAAFFYLAKPSKQEANSSVV